MKAIIVRCDLFGDKDPRLVRYYERFILNLMEAVCRSNLDYLKLFPETPSLYKSGIYYQPEEMRRASILGYPVDHFFGNHLRSADLPAIEDWLDIPTLYSVGHGDCEDLTMARVAELRKAGVRAEPWLKWSGVNIPGIGELPMYHALVKLKGNSFEDPSKILGMGQ